MVLIWKPLQTLLTSLIVLAEFIFTSSASSNMIGRNKYEAKDRLICETTVPPIMTSSLSSCYKCLWCRRCSVIDYGCISLWSCCHWTYTRSQPLQFSTTKGLKLGSTTMLWWTRVAARDYKRKWTPNKPLHFWWPWAHLWWSDPPEGQLTPVFVQMSRGRCNRF